MPQTRGEFVAYARPPEEKSHMNRVCSTGLTALFALLAVSIGYAQSDLGSIQGFVKDPSGASVPSAKVTVHNQSGLERRAVTNESGYFVITSIPPGYYSVAIEAAGFKKYESLNNKLDPSSALAVDAALVVGA